MEEGGRRGGRDGVTAILNHYNMVSAFSCQYFTIIITECNAYHSISSLSRRLS